MKKILISFSMIFLLIGCSKNDFDYYKDSYIEEQGITNINEMMSYEEKPDIKLIVFKGRLDDNEEYLYCFEGLPGSKKDGEYKNGSYTGILLEVEEGMSYDIHNGEDYGYDKSYFVGIAYKEMTSVYYKDKKIDFKTANVKLNNEEIILTVWIMPFNNGEDIYF